MYICLTSHIDNSHDPESRVHIGLLFPTLVRQVGLVYVVLCNRTVSQHIPEMMQDLSPIPCVIPTARLGEERVCYQWAHQGSEPNEEMKSLGKCRKNEKRNVNSLTLYYTHIK